MTLPITSPLKGSPHNVGVPTPYAVHVHPYPSVPTHGGQWIRPVFGLPWVLSPAGVFKPDDFARAGAGTNVPAIRGVPNSAYGRYPFPMSPKPSFAGLGAGALGMQYDTSRGIFGAPGQGSGIFAADAAHGLGQLKTGLSTLVAQIEAGTTEPGTGNGAPYPWRTYSKNTANLQARMNAVLKRLGYCPIGVDGKLGPATCGAWAVAASQAAFEPVAMGASCRETGAAPRRPPCPGAGTSAAIPKGVAPGVPDAATTAQMPSGGPSTKAIAFAVGGVAAAGFVFFYAKKKGLL